MSAADCRWRAARLERLFVACLPIVEIVGASSHEGRVVAVVTETLVAGVAQEIAQHARLVIMINGEGLVHVLLQADDTHAILSTQHRTVALQRQSVPSFEVALTLGLGAMSESARLIFGIRPIPESPLCVDGILVLALERTAARL